jgi:tRNA(Ile)-lysidine synthase
MLLVVRWSGRPPALVVTVDHGLRPEAAAEARLVADNAGKLGLPWRIMRAPARGQRGNLQDWARRARYRCLAEAAQEAGSDTIVTAHHRDDQAETFLLRLARGSGVYGLAAMAEEGTVEGLRLVRPLLGISRGRLAEIAAASGLATVADPSNEDLRFERVRLRRLMPALAEHGFTPERLAETAGRLGRAAAALDHYVERLIRERFQADPFGVISGPATAFAEVPEEVGLRALALILKSAGGADYTPRLDRLEALREAILAKRDGSLKRTLHGVVVTVRAGMLAARREWGRAGLPAIAAPAGSTLVWDRRFRVRVPELPGSLSIGPLGGAARRLRSAAADHATIRALPGLYAGAELLAAPEAIAVADQGEPLLCLAAECLVGRRLGLPAAPLVSNSA